MKVHKSRSTLDNNYTKIIFYYDVAKVYGQLQETSTVGHLMHGVMATNSCISSIHNGTIFQTNDLFLFKAGIHEVESTNLASCLAL